jgi:hypothetical protein
MERSHHTGMASFTKASVAACLHRKWSSMSASGSRTPPASPATAAFNIRWCRSTADSCASAHCASVTCSATRQGATSRACVVRTTGAHQGWGRGKHCTGDHGPTLAPRHGEAPCTHPIPGRLDDRGVAVIQGVTVLLDEGGQHGASQRPAKHHLGLCRGKHPLPKGLELGRAGIKAQCIRGVLVGGGGECV